MFGTANQFGGTTQFGSSGFNPMGTAFQTSTAFVGGVPGLGDDDELDLEERERLIRVEREQEEIKRALNDKADEDDLKKKKRKEQGSKAIQEWKAEREKQIK